MKILIMATRKIDEIAINWQRHRKAMLEKAYTALIS